MGYPAQSSVGAAFLSFHATFTHGIPNQNAAIWKDTARHIGIGASFNGPVELSPGEMAFFAAGWLMAIYKGCGDAVLASDPTQPFVDPESGLGPCDFVREVLPLDAALDMNQARQVLDTIQIEMTFDGEPLPKVATTTKPFENLLGLDPSDVQSCEDFAFNDYIFAILSDFNYLDPSGKTRQDTCVAKEVGAPIPQEWLTPGTHEGSIRLTLESIPEVDDFPIEIIVQ